MAQALYESDYNDQYVLQALYKKGYDHKQSVWIMRSAEMENVSQRAKTSRLGVIVFGVAWVVIFALLFLTSKNRVSTLNVRREVAIPGRYWLIAATVFIGSLVNWIYATRQVARIKQKLPADPSGIEENAIP